MKGAIQNYFYYVKKNATALYLGVSSYGTAVTKAEELNINMVLSSPGADINTTGVIGHLIDSCQDKVIIIKSSIKGAMNAYEQFVMGYDKGLLTFDFTYGLSQEKIPWATICTTDIAQTNHLIAFGPCTPNTHEEVDVAAGFAIAWVIRVVSMIHNKTIPQSWSPSLQNEIYKRFCGVLDINKVTLT